MSNNTPLSKLAITFTFEQEGTNDTIQVELPLVMVWALHRVTKAFGPNLTELVALIGAHAIKAKRTYTADGEQVATEMPTPLNDDERRQVRIMVHEVANATQDMWHKSDELLIEASYEALRSGTLTRGQAAEFASALLGRTVSTDTWTKRVDRWVKQKGLPKIEIYQRKTDKEK
ncbi:MAG: hypothetical protein M3R24_20570 [Chloroflexota bacterium]|nr:hypothetical protein [Chloroflexota bacterium]